MKFNKWVVVRVFKRNQNNIFVLLIDIATVFKSDALEEQVRESELQKLMSINFFIIQAFYFSWRT